MRPVETFSEALPLPPDPSEGQAVRAQRTRLGEVDKGQYVSASHHPGEVDYATMLWLTRAPYQMTTNSHLLEVRAMPTLFHINWALNPSWF